MIKKKIENVTIEFHTEGDDKFVLLRISDRPGFSFMLKPLDDYKETLDTYKHIFDKDEFLELLQTYDDSK